MKNKFTIELTWHNCADCPPSEYWNDNLYITNGNRVCHTEYSKERGWYNKTDGYYIYPELIKDFWWADLEQTVVKSREFQNMKEN